MNTSLMNVLRTCALAASTLLLVSACGADDEAVKSDSPAEPTTAAQEINPTFEIRPVRGMVEREDAAPSDPDGLVVEGTIPRMYTDLGPVVVGADGVHSAALRESEGEWWVDILFTADGSDAFEELTSTAACATEPGQDLVAVLVDGQMVSFSSPEIECGESISGSTEIGMGSAKARGEGLVDQIIQE